MLSPSMTTKSKGNFWRQATICVRDFVLRLIAAAGIADDREPDGSIFQRKRELAGSR